MKLIKGGVTAPKGFLAGAVSCGIKKSGRNDLALLISKAPAMCAAVFTTNKFKSGSLVLSAKRVKKGVCQAIIVNSGNANCCIGKRESEDAEAITNLAAKRLGLNNNLVLIASTGIIGRPLPVKKIKNRLALLVRDLKKQNSARFAKTIMTTDTVHKEIAVSLNIGGKKIKIGGAAKGSGMISPNMATMLAFFTTDAAIKRPALKQAFEECVAGSFNKITVDGDMSTNDTAIMFANGLAGNRPIKKAEPDYSKFLNALKFVSKELARKIVLDGEGATRFIEVSVKGAGNEEDAERIARRIADSNLIKTMAAGGDPNWGRVAASIGSSEVNLGKDKVDIYFGKRLVMKNGAGTKVTRKALSDLFKKKEIAITVDLKSGKGDSKIWTCDLTEEYVRINARYEA